MNGLGDIVEAKVDDLENQSVILSGSHYSYPFAFFYNNEEKVAVLGCEHYLKSGGTAVIVDSFLTVQACS